MLRELAFANDRGIILLPVSHWLYMEVTNGSTPPRSLGHAVPTESWDYVSQAAGEGSGLISFDCRLYPSRS